MLMRLTITGFLLALLACGGSDTGEPAGTGGEPATSAPGGEAASAPKMPTAAQDEKMQECIDLLNSGVEFQEALPTCAAAMEADPEGQKLLTEETLAAIKAHEEARKQAAAEPTAE